ncbi:CHAT domain-containing protein [Dapis sp. BLCC M229]|uniref:CHAT domain-containing protein n=1 Tax=Dapis sp. BLCC M229 TaxID=3400188 RepID=UPI003CE93713
MQLNVENLEAISGSGGVFFDVGNVNIGGVSEDVNGIATGAGGDIILESQGDVTVTENISTDIFTDGETGGDINIAAKNLSVIDGAAISANTFAKGDAGNVEIHATDTVVFDGGDSGSLTGVFSSVESGAEGNAGGVTITTGSLEVINGAFISTNTLGTGDAGSVEIHATDTIVFDGGDSEFFTGVASSVAPGAEGDAGGVTITTGSLEVKNGAQISASTFGKGNAGTVKINATDTIVFDRGDSVFFTAVASQVGPEAEGDAGGVTITTGSLEIINGAQILASTFGKGDAGTVEINATETVVLDGGDSVFSTGVGSQVNSGAEGDAGGVTITTGSLEIINGALISANTEGKGNAGTVEIHATETVVIDGGDSEFATGVTSSVAPEAEGDAEGVTITTGSLEVINGAQISASTFGNGDAGTVEIHATDTVLFDLGDSEIFTGVASNVAQRAEGKGGDVTITTGSLEIINGAQISTSTRGKGDAGTVEIHATETVVIDGRDSEFVTGVFSAVAPEAEGDAEGVTITTGSLEIINGAFISANTQGKGNGGTVEINATETVVIDGRDSVFFAGVASSVEEGAEGKGGDVTITTGSLEVINGARISASTFGNGDAGNIFITTDTQLTLNENAQISAFTESTGDGGNIILFAPETLNISGNGQITVRSSSTGKAGQIDIISPNITLSDGIDITAFTEGPGNAGNINLEGNNINIQPNTQILAFTESSGKGGKITIRATETLNLQADTQLSVETNRGGKAGDIEITTPQLTIGENAQISATVNIGATTTEAGGNITINTNQLDIAGELGIFAETDATADAGILSLSPYKTNPNLDITFTNDGFISASTSSTGNGGNINISAPESINIKGDGNISVETTDKGNAGAINIDTQNLTLSDGVAISASTEDKGNAGAININTRNLTLETGTSLTTETNNQGQAGNIEINTRQLTIGEDAQISATAREGATNTEAGGNITINATDLLISGRLGIFAETAGETPAGTLTLNPYRNNQNLNITFTNEGFISARTTSTGDGGNINIFAPENINITGEGKISVETTGTGNAGTINIEAENLTLSEGVAISAETDSFGTAGNIEITTQQLTIGENTSISATAQQNATTTEAGGNITINSTDILISGILGIFAETTGDSPAGSININPDQTNPNLNITFTENGFISARTTAEGDGGNINIFAPENIDITGQGRITVETEGAGNAGIINIETENLTVAENITISAATSNIGDGGSININPSQTFQLEGQILTETTGTGNGGNITINTGELSAENSIISAKSTDTGNAGTIEITAKDNITTGIVTSEANNTTATANGGKISIISEQGEINATQPIQSFSNRGNAGNVTLQAQTDITTNTISSHGQQQGGQITITSETGNIDTSNSQFLANYSGGGDGGNVTIEATQGNITTSDIYSFADADGGQITIKAGGDINIREDSNIISASEPPGEQGSEGVGRGGDIILEAGNNINTTTAIIYSGADIGNTGKINIIADGAIETGQIDLASGFVRQERPVNNNFTLIPVPQGEATQGVAGNITLRSNNSTIDSTAGTINSRSPDGTGNINLNARDNITTGKLEASALNPNQPTTGGDVSITSEQGEINATQAIETFSLQGTAGNVNIIAEGSVNIENILSQGTQQGGNITIDSRSQNSINAQGALNTFSTEGIAGDVNLTSPGNITINGIRSEGIQQGGEIRVESEIGEITSTENIDSFSEQGIGGNVLLNASESINLANVSSFGATESGDLIIQSRTAQVNTGNVTTQAPAGSSGSIIINGTEVGTGDLSSIGTTSAGEINVEATDGSITTYDIEISSDGTIGDLILRATEDITTGDINQNAGEGDANANIDSGEDQTTGDINQIADNDANLNQTTGEDLNTGDINQTAGNDANINQTAGGDINTPVINQTVGNNANINQTAGGDINTPVINQNPGNESITIQNPQTNQNTDSTSVISNDNNNSIINPLINQNNPQNNINTLNNFTNNTTTNFPETNSFSTTTTSEIISTATPSNNNQTTNTDTAKEKTEKFIKNTTDTQQILNIIDTFNTNPLTVTTGSDQIVTMLEQNRNKEYSDYFGEDFNQELVNTKNVRDILTDMAAQTGKESAVVYINAYADQIQIILFTKDGQPILKNIPTVNREKIRQNAIIFSGEITDWRMRHTTSYLPLAQKLYKWLIAPISAELEAANIETILFSMDNGFRLLPLAALHDGKQFLIEKYSISLIPSVSLMDSRYNSVKNTTLLAMGASQFTDEPPLPAVPIELQTISEKLWRGNTFLNEDFTKNNLMNQLENRLYPIVHLATHAEFRAGNASDSYIHLWNDKLGLDEVRKLRWNSDKAELLVLSACRTAVGDRNAELGFAGLAIATGVKSALGSFWLVSDEGTLGLMTEFYAHLSNVKIKAEALRKAQLAMLRGEVVIENGKLRGSGSRGEVSLPPELANIQNKSFAHPYYWAGFTMVGSPW